MRKIITLSYVSLIFYAIILLPSIALSGITGKISGKVLDADTNLPLAGVNVVISGTGLGAATGLSGSFTILNIPPGVYTVKASFIGFKQTNMENVHVSVGLTTKIEFNLSTSAIVGEEVIVISERPIIVRDRTSSEVHISSDELEFTPIQEMSDILQTKAGITKDAGGGLHFRGGRSSEVVYMVDGIPVTDVFDGALGVELEKSSILELQIVTGTFNAEYGEAMSGIVNIITKTGGKNLHGSLTFYAGDYNSGDTELFMNLDDLNPVENYNIQGSLSGPLPLTSDKFRFYANARSFSSQGYLYGARSIVNLLDNTDPADIQIDTVEVGDPILSDLREFQLAQNIEDGRILLFHLRIPDSLIRPMNWEEKTSFQGKLSYRPMQNTNIHLNYIFNKRDFQDYDHFYRLNTNGNVNKFDRGNTITLSLNQAVSSKTFYTIKVSRFQSEFQEYLFEDPLDSRYKDPILLNSESFAFNISGTNLHHFYRKTVTDLLKADLTSQVNLKNEVKFGFEIKQHSLSLDDFTIVAAIDPITGTTIEPFEPDVLERSTPNHLMYDESPVQYSGYLQDKIEHENMIVNIGIRLDHFNSNGRKLVDESNPNVYNPFSDWLRDGSDSIWVNKNDVSLEERQKIWYKDVSSQTNISPRLGIAFPITDKGVIHFSYGHFLQIPQFRFLYDKPEWKLTESAGLQGPYGNAALKPERTVKYEIGLQQQVFDNYSVELSGYFKDIRDWVSGGEVPKSTTVAGIAWTEYINNDYANVRGFSTVIQRRLINNFGFNVDYNFQIAEGSNSDADAQFFALLNNGDPAKRLSPLDWDQTHSLNGSLFFGGKQWSVSFLGQYGSGLPYSPFIEVSTRTGRDVATSLPRNSRTKPQTFNLDMQAHRTFSFGAVGGKIFLRVFNVFDRRNALNVFGDTGLPDITLNVANIQESTLRLNTIGQWHNFPTNYSVPRNIQWGVDLFF